MEKNKIYHGNNLDILRTFEDNSIDSIVTDPPYGISFMNKKWDYDVPTVEFWREALRVLKPGGHALVACGTRTQHRMAVNLEDAGFEIRDIVAWVYSSGFPKALDIEKELKKMLKNFVNSGIMDVGDNNENRNEREIPDEQKTEHNLRPLWKEHLQTTEFNEEKFREILQSFMQEQGLQISRDSASDVWERQSCMEGWSDDEEEQGELQGCEICKMPERIYRDVKKRWIYNGTSISDGKTLESNIEENRSDSSYRPQSDQQRNNEFDTIFIKWRTQKIRRITAKIKEISGWKTALKPAMELWTLCRKPLQGTVANNVLKYGVGGINIDGCRVETDDEMTPRNNKVGQNGVFNASGGYVEPNSLGRFPANFIHDGSDEVEALFPYTKSGVAIREKSSGETFGGQGHKRPPMENLGYDDGGGSAARFFYTAKASQTERNWGLGEFDESITTDGRIKSIDNAFNRGETKRKNIHPTVKPIDLMRYLVRLITPKGGICLDPFMGSGTTAVACKAEKFDYIGCELEAEYIKISEARIKAEVVVYDIFDFT